MAAIVDVEVLGELILGAFVGGIGITAVFGFVIYGTTRLADMRREGNVVAAAFFAALSAVALIAFAGSVVLGLLVMTDK